MADRLRSTVPLAPAGAGSNLTVEAARRLGRAVASEAVGRRYDGPPKTVQQAGPSSAEGSDAFATLGRGFDDVGIATSYGFRRSTLDRGGRRNGQTLGT
jgi:hypothetical protein